MKSHVEVDQLKIVREKVCREIPGNECKIELVLLMMVMMVMIMVMVMMIQKPNMIVIGDKARACEDSGMQVERRTEVQTSKKRG